MPQTWKCGACGEEFLVEKDEPNSPQLKKAMEHMMMAHPREDYERFKEGVDKFLLSCFLISNN